MTSASVIRVEFYGIPRRRAGVSAVDVSLPRTADQPEVTLADLLAALAEKFPPLAEECFPHGELLPSYVMNLSGERFLRDPQTMIAAGAVLLFLSTDAGG